MDNSFTKVSFKESEYGREIILGSSPGKNWSQKASGCRENICETEKGLGRYVGFRNYDTLD